MKILLVIYDNDAHLSEFPVGMSYIAAICKNAGHDVKIYNQDVYHWPESHLTELLNKDRYDMVGVSVIGGYYQYQKLLKISAAINQAKNRPFYVLGGHGPAPEPEYFLKKTKAEVIVIGEGENTVIELLDYLAGRRSLSSIKGIAYREDGKCSQNPKRELIENIDRIPFPAWDLFPMEHYVLQRFPRIQNRERSMAVLSGRGCRFKCNFCYRMDSGFRARSAESIIEEIRMLKNNYQVSYIAFYDELLMSSVSRIEDLCRKFIKAKLNIHWYCNGRLNYAKKDILKLMKDAGCVFINYGIESMDEKILNVMNKALTVKQIVAGIENTLASGISPGFNIIFGNIGETAESLEKGVEFLLKYDDHSQLRTIRPVTPYPGSPLYYYAIEKGLLKDCADFYENKHLNSDLLSANVSGLSDEEFYRCLYQANLRLINNYNQHNSERIREVLKKLYIDKDPSFRGFRHT
jgi:anaerobic magnesium-protoporphyrin IX monomethyl ester cyclase